LDLSFGKLILIGGFLFGKPIEQYWG